MAISDNLVRGNDAKLERHAVGQPASMHSVILARYDKPCRVVSFDILAEPGALTKSSVVESLDLRERPVERKS